MRGGDGGSSEDTNLFTISSESYFVAVSGIHSHSKRVHYYKVMLTGAEGCVGLAFGQRRPQVGRCEIVIQKHLSVLIILRLTHIDDGDISRILPAF